ncbi:hypothetical protein C6P42_000992 [Pichia californica]|nr:hypothetical protein C6P42_000992 [[Candida] californica]
MNGTDAVELKMNANNETINLEKFWKMVDDLFYTKVYYDSDTQEYFTKHYKNSFTQKIIQDAKYVSGDNNDESTTIETTSTTSNDSEDEYDLELCTEDEINTLLVSFITLVSNYCDPLIAQVGDDDFFNSVAEYIMHFKYYQNHIDFCIRKMLSLLVYSVDMNLNNLQLNVDTLDESMKDKVNEDIGANEKFIKIIGWIFHKHYEHYKTELLEALKEYNGFVILSRVLQNYVTVSQQVNDPDMFSNSYKNYMILTFDLCKNYNFSDYLEIVKLSDISYLFENLKVETRDENEINFLKFRLLLVLNEQYMFQCGLKLKKDENVNCVVNTLVNKITFFQVFNEILILNFNREMDRVDQILMLKFLYVVFSNKVTNNMVYLNDLKVIVDIIIRQLFDLQLGNSEYLVNIYIRVLHCILTTTDLRNYHYKKAELLEVLQYIISSDDAMEKTKHLAEKCNNCLFFMNNNSTDSLMSTSTKTLNKQQSNKSFALGENQIFQKIGQETAHALMNPATTLINIPTHIMHNVVKAPGVATSVATHILSTPYKVANNLMPYFDNEPGKDIHISGSNTPPPPPPRLSDYSHIHSYSQSNLQNHEPIIPHIDVQKHHRSASLEPHASSLSLSSPPPPPPSRPYIRSQNSSVNEINNISAIQIPVHDKKKHTHLAAPSFASASPTPPLPPPPPICRRAMRRGSGDGDISIRSTSLSGTSSPNISQSPLPPPPPPRSRSSRNTGSSEHFISANNTGSNDSELQNNSGKYSDIVMGNGMSMKNNGGIRYKNERNGSVLSVNSLSSSENGEVLQPLLGRLKRAPPPPPR